MSFMNWQRMIQRNELNLKIMQNDCLIIRRQAGSKDIWMLLFHIMAV